jgi:hypothetical protein
MGASRQSLTYESSAASRSARSLATSASSTTGALQGCSSATRRARRPTAFLTQGHNVCARRSVRQRARMGMGESGGRWLDSDVRQLHCQVRPLRGSWGVGSSLPPSMSTPVPEPLPTSAPRSPAMTSTAMRSSPPPPQPVPPCTPAATATPPGTCTPTPARVENSVEFATPLSHDEERIDAYHDGEPLRYRTMENLLGD